MTYHPASGSRIAATGLTGMLGLRLQKVLSQPGWGRLAVDITDSAGVASAVSESDADVIVGLAAYTDVSAAWQQRGDVTGPCFRINVEGTKNLAQACVDAGKHFVHVSTDYVFEGDRDNPYTETDEPDAETDWYGVTKRTAEEHVRASDGSWSIVRVSFPYQPHSDGREDFVRRIMRLLRTGALNPLFNDQVITPTFVDDACAVLDAVATTRGRGVFHAVGPEWLTPYQIGNKIAERLGISADEVPSGSLRSYVELGGRAFPVSLKMSNTATMSILGTSVHMMSQALSTASRSSQSS